MGQIFLSSEKSASEFRKDIGPNGLVTKEAPAPTATAPPQDLRKSVAQSMTTKIITE